MDYARAWMDLNERLSEVVSASGGLDAALTDLESHQRQTGFIKDDLSKVERYAFEHPENPSLTFRVQYNPKRALRFLGSGVRTAPPQTENLNDGCFLCRENIRWQQQNAQVGFEISLTEDVYHAWMNPFPLLPNHVVIAEEDHISQEWDMGGDPDKISLSRLLQDLCEMAVRLPNHVGFYNGVDAGASIPSHLHFQFVRRPGADPIFPLEQRDVLPATEDGGPQFITDYPVAVAVWRGNLTDVVSNAIAWVRRCVAGSALHHDVMSSNFIVTSHHLGSDVSLYFIPRDRRKSRWFGTNSLVGGLELLGEFVFSSEAEKALLDQGEVDFFYLEQALASIHTPFFDG